ncbi:exodeoxyribonuclease III [Exophiala viscosa]|uniref:Exodeoxyribonuclease III n=1 Tax=Exophiala viscosa TaxID=2486360 RepID=A0AAN6E4L8_9EURO|nr:exodeoxyribonuclease III [Exophiala viscosa]
MSSPLKRSLSTTGRSISPPPLQRKIPRLTEHVSSTREPSVDQLRIFSWNVNGVGPLLQKQLSFSADSLSPLRTFLKRHHWPQFLCLQEVKISSKDTATQRRLQAAANQSAAGDEPSYTIEFSLPRDKYNATGFGGKVHGVATLIRDDFGSRLRATRRPDWDLEGRVLVHELDMGLVVINGYWVNGTSNPYRDPETGQVVGTRHDHKLRFHQWMLDEALRLERSGLHVILIGDMNIARARIDGHPNLRTSPVQHVKNRADFNAKFFTYENGLSAVDVFRHKHGNRQKYTYHPRGRNWGESCDRVDLIVVSRSLVDPLDAVAETDILDNALDRGHSDHVPLWVALDMSIFSAKAAQSGSD